MSHVRVAVLRGGPSEEYAVSMRTGNAVIGALQKLGFFVKDVVITKNGDWLDSGYSRSPEQALKAIDVVFIALHGAYGEDGGVQKILQRIGIPFTGSRAFPSAIAFNKDLTKQTLKNSGILMPEHRLVKREDGVTLDEQVAAILSQFGPQYIIKPITSGSSVGVQYVSAPDSLRDSLKSALDSYDSVMVEQYIRGREATAATLEGFRSEDIYVFPTIEIVTPRSSIYFDTEAKYNGETQELCPSRFSFGERKQIEATAAMVHKLLDLAQYSRSDFIVADDGIYFLEVNTLPGLTEQSLYPKAAQAVGLSLDDLVKHLVHTATC